MHRNGKNDKAFVYDNVSVEIYENGTVRVRTNKTPLFKLKFTIANTYFKDAVIDEAALMASLKGNRFRALFDVYEQELLAADYLLRALDNVMLFPPYGRDANDRHEKITDALIDDIVRFENG